MRGSSFEDTALTTLGSGISFPGYEVSVLKERVVNLSLVANILFILLSI